MHSPPRKIRKSSLEMATITDDANNRAIAAYAGTDGPSIQSIPHLGATDLATAAG